MKLRHPRAPKRQHLPIGTLLTMNRCDMVWKVVAKTDTHTCVRYTLQSLGTEVESVEDSAKVLDLVESGVLKFARGEEIDAAYARRMRASLAGARS